MEATEKRIIRKCASTSSLGAQPSTHVLRSYNLNHQKALEKKKVSCDKEHVVSEWKANNLVIEFSTSTYELFKTLLHQLLAKSTSYKPKTTEGVDYQNAIVDSCIKVYNRLRDGSMGRTLKFVINLYHTSSRVVVNGNRVDLFVSDIYGDLCAKLSTHYEDLSVINKGIFDTIDLTSISKTKEQQTNNDIQKDNNLGLPYCQTSSSNLVENPCLTNGPPKALTMVTSCNESTGTSSDSAQDSITIVKNNSVSAIQDSIHVHLCICPLCNQEAGENTIECGQCEEWIHFSCGNINNPSSMGDKVYVCPVCSDNLLYAPRQSPDKMSSHSNDINSENSKTYAINRKRSVSDSLTINTMNPDTLDDSKNMGPSPNKQNCLTSDTLEVSKNMGPSPNNQNCLSSDKNKDLMEQKQPEGPKSKYKKQPIRQNSKPNRDNSIEKAYIGQLESEIDRLQSTVELFKKSQQKGMCTEKPLLEQQISNNSYIREQQSVGPSHFEQTTAHHTNIEIKFLEQRMRAMETHMSQSMQIIQLQQTQLMMQVQAQQHQQNMYHMQTYQHLPPKPPAYVHMQPVHPLHTNINQHGFHPNYGINPHIHSQFAQPMQLPNNVIGQPHVNRHFIHPGHYNQGVNNSNHRYSTVQEVQNSHRSQGINPIKRPMQAYTKQQYKSEKKPAEIDVRYNKTIDQTPDIHDKEQSDISHSGQNISDLDTNVPLERKLLTLQENMQDETHKPDILNSFSIHDNNQREVITVEADIHNSFSIHDNNQREVIIVEANVHTNTCNSGKDQTNASNHFLETTLSRKKPPELLLIEEVISNRD